MRSAFVLCAAWTRRTRAGFLRLAVRSHSRYGPGSNSWYPLLHAAGRWVGRPMERRKRQAGQGQFSRPMSSSEAIGAKEVLCPPLTSQNLRLTRHGWHRPSGRSGAEVGAPAITRRKRPRVWCRTRAATNGQDPASQGHPGRRKQRIGY
jgi:hypothetical protein